MKWRSVLCNVGATGIIALMIFALWYIGGFVGWGAADWRAGAALRLMAGIWVVSCFFTAGLLCWGIYECHRYLARKCRAYWGVLLVLLALVGCSDPPKKQESFSWIVRPEVENALMSAAFEACKHEPRGFGCWGEEQLCWIVCGHMRPIFDGMGAEGIETPDELNARRQPGGHIIYARPVEDPADAR